MVKYMSKSYLTNHNKALACAFALVLVITGACLALAPGFSQPANVRYGPRADALIFPVYTSEEALFLALKAGEIHTADWNIPSDRVSDVVGSLNLNIYTMDDMGMFEITANCLEYPTNITAFRWATALLVDNERLVTEVMRGLGTALDTPVPPFYGAWVNPNIPSIPYDPAEAARIFDSLGFTKNAEGKRIDPKTGQPLIPIRLYGRSDDFRRRTAAEWLAAELRALGFAVDLRLGPSALINAEVIASTVTGERKTGWHFATTGWGLTPDLDYLYWFFATDAPAAYNTPGFSNSTFDALADIILEDPDYEDVFNAVQAAQQILYEQEPYIMLYARSNLNVFNTEWEGYVRAAGDNPANFWTYLNVRPAGQESGGIFRAGQLQYAEDVNPFTYQWWWEARVIGEVYDGLLAIHPYTLQDIPWLAERWTVQEEGEGLLFTFYLVQNATWHDGQPFDADDVVFTYEKALEVQPSRWTMIDFVTGVDKIDQYTVAVHCNTKSYWAIHLIQPPVIVPEHIWSEVDDVMNYDPAEEGTFIGTGAYKFVERKTGEYYRFVANTDYFRSPDWFMGVADWLDAPADFRATILAPIETSTGARLNVSVIVYKGNQPTSTAGVTVALIDPLGVKITELNATYSAATSAFIASIPTSGLPSGSYSIHATAFASPIPVKATAAKTITLIPAEIAALSQEVDSLGRDLSLARAEIADLTSDLQSLSGTLNIALGVAAVAGIVALGALYLALKKK